MVKNCYFPAIFWKTLFQFAIDHFLSFSIENFNFSRNFSLLFLVEIVIFWYFSMKTLFQFSVDHFLSFSIENFNLSSKWYAFRCWALFYQKTHEISRRKLQFFNSGWISKKPDWLLWFSWKLYEIESELLTTILDLDRT